MEKEIVFSHYTVKNLNLKAWKQTWNNLVSFVKDFEATAGQMNIKLTLRKIILDDITNDNLKKGNMVTFFCSYLKQEETPIEELLTMKLSYSPCDDTVSQQGFEVVCRTLTDYKGEKYQSLPKDFFEDIVLRLAFQAPDKKNTACTDCSNCTIGCEKDKT